MNSKYAKALRRIARSMAASAGITLERQLNENESKRKYRFTPKLDEFGNPLKAENGTPLFNVDFVGAGMLTNEPQSVRGIYRNLKLGKAESVAA